MQILCPRCLADEREGYSMCSRCGQRFPLTKLVVEVPVAVDEPCELCDREAFFGHRECENCGRALRPLRVSQR